MSDTSQPYIWRCIKCKAIALNALIHNNEKQGTVELIFLIEEESERIVPLPSSKLKVQNKLHWKFTTSHPSKQVGGSKQASWRFTTSWESSTSWRFTTNRVS